MNLPILTSRDNPLVREIRLGAAQSRRSSPDVVVAEGTRVLEEAEAAGTGIEAVLVSEGFGADERERALLDSWMARKVPVRRAAASLMKEISDVVTPQGAVALARVPRQSLESVVQAPNPLVLFLCGISDPGNIGTILRTARAAGVSLVGCTIGSVSARNPKAIRASAGAFFHLPVVEALTPDAIRSYCRQRGLRMLQTSVRGERSCWEADFSGPLALLMGNEARGLDESDWRGIPAVRVPMAQGVESLNVAVAAAALLYEAFRQRSATSPHAAKDFRDE